MQPERIVVAAVATGQQLQHRIELVEGSDEQAAEATLEAEHAVQAIEFTAILLEDFAVEPKDGAEADCTHKISSYAYPNCYLQTIGSKYCSILVQSQWD